MPDTPSLFSFYEAAVQCVEADVEFIEERFLALRDREPQTLREDFCGTAALAAWWASRGSQRRSWAIDLDRPTLEWGKENRVGALASGAERVELMCADVRAPKKPLVDVQTAFNFSYWIFRTRVAMLEYFQTVHRSLNEDGMFFLDLFGGTESMTTVKEETEHSKQKDAWGVRLPKFSYTWHQRTFNPINNEMECAIHFKVGKKRYRKAFLYDWRVWTLPELRELLADAGFSSCEVYVEGWDEDDEPNGIFTRRETFDNEGSWIAYLVAAK